MGTDSYGNEIHIGSVVTIVGYSDRYIVSDLLYSEEVANLSPLDGSFAQNGINTNNLIKEG